MGFLIRCPRLALVVGTALALAGNSAATRADYSISNNLTGISGGAETASGTTWIAAGFSSGATGGLLSSVTLKLANIVTGQAEVDLYRDDVLEPGTSLGQLTLVGTYTSTATATTFKAAGITLAANTNYWVVLKALTGQFDWSWNLSNTGTGAGYQGTWGEADDAGSTWFTYDSYATQMNVLLVSPSAVPEPATWILWGFGGLGVAVFRERQARLPRWA